MGSVSGTHSEINSRAIRLRLSIHGTIMIRAATAAPEAAHYHGLTPEIFPVIYFGQRKTIPSTTAICQESLLFKFRHEKLKAFLYLFFNEVSMKCIDAIEGTVKCIIKEMHTAHSRNSSDDSEYIYNVKTVIDATDQYVRNQAEFIDDPGILKQVLYLYSRDLWLTGQYPVTDDSQSKTNILDEDNDEYQTYYYDYIYNRGVYPG